MIELVSFQMRSFVASYLSRLSKKQAGQVIPEDRISQLPDEILCCILSVLTLKEAGRTSVLPKRWKNVWTYIPELDFSAVNTLCSNVEATVEYMDRLARERVKFVNWVNKVLESCETLELNKFKITCDMDYSSQVDISKWLQYALDRRVQRLEQNLFRRGPRILTRIGNYNFPAASFAHRSFKSLKVLVLKLVDVSGDDLQFFKKNCEFLESLLVHQSSKVLALEVCNPSLALRNLEICSCPIKTVIVCNANLVTLNTLAPGGVVLDNVPQLVHLSLTSWTYFVEILVRQLSCCFSKLEVLSLHLDTERIREYDGKLPQLSALKQLFIELWVGSGEGMCGVASFFGASPKLEKFVIKMNYHCHKVIDPSMKSENVVNYCVQHLSVVEISGYRGYPYELNIVKYVLENAVSLEELIVDPRFVYELYDGEPWSKTLRVRTQEAKITNDSRRCANQQLLGVVPSHVRLVIL